MPDDRRFPWLKLYTAAIRNDTKLLMCALASRAVAFLILTLMSESERRGYLLVNGKNPDEKTLVKCLHITRRAYRKARVELVEHGVFVEDGFGVLHSPRMVRDHAKYLEAARHGRRGASKRFSGQDDATDAAILKGGLKGGLKDTPQLRGESGEARDQRSDQRGAVPHAPTAGPPVPKDIRPRVPPPMHDEFLSKLGDVDQSNLITFYKRVSAEWKGRTIDVDDFTFWRERWREWRGTATRTSKPTGRTLAADIDAGRQYLEQQRRAAQ